MSDNEQASCLSWGVDQWERWLAEHAGSLCLDCERDRIELGILLSNRLQVEKHVRAPNV